MTAMAPHIEAVTATSNIIFLPLKDIAPFAVLPKNAWDVKGIDFSLPCDERKTYEARRELELEAAGIQQPGVGSTMNAPALQEIAPILQLTLTAAPRVA